MASSSLSLQGIRCRAHPAVAVLPCALPAPSPWIDKWSTHVVLLFSLPHFPLLSLHRTLTLISGPSSFRRRLAVPIAAVLRRSELA